MKISRHNSPIAWIAVVAGFAATPGALAFPDPPRYELWVPINGGQITDNTLPFNDVWLLPLTPLTPPPVLNGQDRLIIDFRFIGGRIRGDDGSVNGDESIHFGFRGAGGPFPFPNNQLQYKMWFTGLSGTEPEIGTPANPITGQCAMNASFDFTRDLDIINGGVFSFADIHLEVVPTSILSPWTIESVYVGFDADTVTFTVPSPAGVLAFAGLLLMVPRRRR